MADGTLSLDEFLKLSKTEQLARCGDLSKEDAYRLRLREPLSAISPPCNRCAHKHAGRLSCAAFPNGLSAGQIRAVMDNPNAACGKGFRFEEKKDGH